MRALVQERHLTDRTFVDQTLAAKHSDPDEIASA
jgi:hypothetical protein